jgi:tetratricopeptide (TPR) repeat protein
MSDSKDLLRLLNLCESEVEKLFLLAAYEHIDVLIPQYTVLRYRIDFAIPDKMIAIEIDGHEFHKTKEQRTHDSQREREIKLALPANWTVIRFTGTEIFQNATLCVDEVLQFIRKTSPSSITITNRPKIQCETDNCDASGLYNKGIALASHGKLDEAIKAYDEAIKIDPQLAYTWVNKGAALGDLGRYDEAIQACDEAIRLDPNYAKAWYNKGFALYNQSKYDEAVQAFDKVIQIKPDFAEAYYNKGIILKALGRTTESDTAFSKAKELVHSG